MISIYMCEVITEKSFNGEIIKKIQKKVEKNVDNPKLLIETFKYNNINLNLIQDGVLLTGSKQRVVKLFLKKILKDNPDIKIIRYAGICNGFGAIASAYGAYKLGLQCEVFLSKTPNLTNNDIKSSRQFNTLHALNAKIHLCNTYKEARQLEYKNSTIEISKNIWETLPKYYLVPMGLKNDMMIDLMSKQMKKAGKNTILENHPNPRIWLVTGSGGIAMSISKAFPNAKLFILLTGGGKYKKTVYEWAKINKNISIVKNEYKLDDESARSDRHLYYSSVSGYDDLIWPYVKKYALEHDFIWNIASDDYIF